jgi:hypothetical protein
MRQLACQKYCWLLLRATPFMLGFKCFTHSSFISAGHCFFFRPILPAAGGQEEGESEGAEEGWGCHQGQQEAAEACDYVGQGHHAAGV